MYDMDANEYQHLAARTLLEHADHMPTEWEYLMLWNGLGLAGEAGEICELLKKGICHRHALDRDELIKELGDVLWYAAALCSKLGVPMSDVMERNIAKLQQRYPDGYSSERSILRSEST
jgi:NTP pyrophosphatase (non-canonical NTP hydrolase)